MNNMNNNNNNNKELYQLSLLCSLIQSNSHSNFAPLISIDTTSLSALKYIVLQTENLQSQENQFLHNKANQLLKVVQHVKQHFQKVKLKINQNQTKINVLSDKQKKIYQLKQRKIKNICGQLILEKMNKKKQQFCQDQQISQQKSIQQPNQSKVSQASTGNVQQKKKKYEQVKIKSTNLKNNTKKQPIKINLIQQSKNNDKSNIFSHCQTNMMNKTHNNQENMMNFNNIQAFQKRKNDEKMKNENLNLSELSRPEYRKTQNFNLENDENEHYFANNFRNKQDQHQHKKVILKKHFHLNDNKFTSKVKPKFEQKRYNSKQMINDKNRQKSPLIKRIMKTEYEQAQIHDQSDDYEQFSNNNNNAKDNQQRVFQLQKKKYNDYFTSTGVGTTDEDNMSTHVKNKNKIRKIEKSRNQQRNFSKNVQKTSQKQKSFKEENQKLKNSQKITLFPNNFNISINAQNQNQTFKTDELFDSHVEKSAHGSFLSGYSSQSDLIRLKAQFQKNIQEINKINEQKDQPLDININANLNLKKQNNLNSLSNFRNHQKKYEQEKYQKVVQEEPWQCDQLQLQEQLKVIDERLSHRANKSPLHKGGINTLSHLQLKNALQQVNQIEDHRQNQPKIVRLSLTPKGCKQLLNKKSKLSIKESTSKSTLKQKSPQYLKSKSQEKLKVNHKKNHSRQISMVSKFDQDLAFPISIEVEVNKNAHIGKWNKNNKAVNEKKDQNQMRHPQRKQLLSDKIQSLNKFY